MKRREWLLAAAGLLVGLLSLLLWLAPRVASFSPQEQAYAPWQPIVIDFSQPIDPTSLAGRFRLDPPVAGDLQVSGRQLLLAPSAALQYGRTYTATLDAGLRATNRLPLLRDHQWTFSLRPPRLLYLREGEQGSELWQLDDTGRDQRLLGLPQGIWDYSPLPDGSAVLYAAYDDDQTLDLYLLHDDGSREQVLDCQDALCRAPAAQPGGQLIAFERQSFGASLAETELWFLDRASGQTWPALLPADLAAAGYAAPYGRFPVWSADGRRLAFHRPDANLVIIFDYSEPGATEIITIPANLESMAGWSPDGRTLAYTELAFGETQPHEHIDEGGQVISHTRPSLYQHVVLADIDRRQASDLSAGLEYEEGRPAWHPSADLLAIPRTTTGSGRQIWLVPLDGGQARQLTDDPFFDHTALAWSPDGRSLAFMRVPRADGAGPPTLMRYDLASNTFETVAEPAYLPAWRP